MTTEPSESDGGFSEAKVYISPEGKTIPRIWLNFKNGRIPWTELDDEELGRGQLRDKFGGFSGRPPSMLPREIAGDVKRRLLERYNENLQEVLLRAQRVFIDVMDDDTASANDRMKASQYVQERIIGKIPDKVEVTAEVKPWEGMVSGILEETDVSDLEG